MKESGFFWNTFRAISLFSFFFFSSGMIGKSLYRLLPRTIPLLLDEIRGRFGGKCNGIHSLRLIFCCRPQPWWINLWENRRLMDKLDQGPRFRERCTECLISNFEHTRRRGNVLKSAYEPTVAHKGGAYLGFYSMKRLGVFLLPPGWDASPSQRYLQH